MAEQQLVDYIKKAREAGQTDEQNKSLLYKNGWTTQEVSDAFAMIQPQAQPKPQAQPQAKPQPKPQPVAQAKPQPQEQAQSKPQPQPQPQVVSQPKVEAQPQMQAKPQEKTQIFPQSATTTQSITPQTKHKSHVFMKIVTVLIIIVVLAGAGLYAAGQYVNFPWNPFWPNPATVISKMAVNMGNNKSYQTSTQLDFSATNSSKVSLGSLSFNVSGKSDVTDINNPKADFTFKINATIPGTASVPDTASIEGEVISVNEVSYLEITSVMIQGTYPISGSDLSKITGAWLSINQDSVKTLLAAEGESTDQFNLQQMNGQEFSKNIQSLLTTAGILSVQKQLGDTVVNGQNAYHYLVKIDKTKLENLINKSITLLMTQSSNSQVQNSTTDASSSLAGNMAQTFVRGFLDAIGDINVEMWVGKTDYMLYQAKVDKVIDVNKLYPGVNIQVEAKLSMANSNFNKLVSVQAPESSQKIEDVVLPLLKSQKIDADVEQIGSVAQSLFSAGSSYSSLCSHGLLNGYQTNFGTNLIDLNKDIVTQGAKKPVCLSDVQDLCVSTQLADGGYLCIDKNNVLGTTRCVSSKTACK